MDALLSKSTQRINEKVEKRFQRNRKMIGAAMVEISLLIVLVALVAVPAIKSTSLNTKCKMYVEAVVPSAYRAGNGAIHVDFANGGLESWAWTFDSLPSAIMTTCQNPGMFAYLFP